MQPCTIKHTTSVKDNDDVIEVSSSECSANDENTPSCDDSQKQLVLYDNGGGEIEATPDPISYKSPSFQRNRLECHAPRVLPSIGAFTVQCANCFKWRLIPNQEKYEEIREHITEKPFVCETAHEWRAGVSCSDPPDIEQDGSRLWAIDKPNIAQTPPGWQRLLRIRGEGSTKFADVYYTAPTGTNLRSIPDIEKYLLKHPEYVEQGVTIAQFSFQIPKPLQEDYVRKRTSRVAALQDGDNIVMPPPPPLEPSPGNANMDLQVGMPRFGSLVKKARSRPAKRVHNFDLMFRQQHH